MDYDQPPGPEARVPVQCRADVAQSPRKLWPRKHVHGDYNPFRPLAGAIVEHLELYRIRCSRKPPPPGHRIPGGPRDLDRNESDTGK